VRAGERFVAISYRAPGVGAAPQCARACYASHGSCFVAAGVGRPWMAGGWLPPADQGRTLDLNVVISSLPSRYPVTHKPRAHSLLLCSRHISKWLGKNRHRRRLRLYQRPLAHDFIAIGRRPVLDGWWDGIPPMYQGRNLGFLGDWGLLGFGGHAHFRAVPVLILSRTEPLSPIIAAPDPQLAPILNALP
jgi:hypothetical protein